MYISGLGDGWFPATFDSDREFRYVSSAHYWIRDLESFWVDGFSNCGNDDAQNNCVYNLAGTGEVINDVVRREVIFSVVYVIVFAGEDALWPLSGRKDQAGERRPVSIFQYTHSHTRAHTHTHTNTHTHTHPHTPPHTHTHVNTQYTHNCTFFLVLLGNRVIVSTYDTSQRRYGRTFPFYYKALHPNYGIFGILCQKGISF